MITDERSEYGPIHQCSVAAHTEAIVNSSQKVVVIAIFTSQSSVNPARLSKQVQICYQRSTKAKHNALESMAEKSQRKLQRYCRVLLCTQTCKSQNDWNALSSNHIWKHNDKIHAKRKKETSDVRTFCYPLVGQRQIRNQGQWQHVCLSTQRNRYHRSCHG